MDNNILSALKSIDVASLTRADWIAVGMALKEEGFPVSVWDEWSKNDSRYKPGECERLWNGFHGSSNPVRGGTIVKLARQQGWSPSGGGTGYDDGTGELDWEDEIFWEVRIPAAAGGERCDQPSIMIVFFSGTAFASFFGMFRLSTPCLKDALISSSVTFSLT